MYYLTRDMAEASGVKRPYTNLQSFLDYKQRGLRKLKAHARKIAKLSETDRDPEENES